jgi:hypothetical protein
MLKSIQYKFQGRGTPPCFFDVQIQCCYPAASFIKVLISIQDFQLRGTLLCFGKPKCNASLYIQKQCPLSCGSVSQDANIIRMQMILNSREPSYAFDFHIQCKYPSQFQIPFTQPVAYPRLDHPPPRRRRDAYLSSRTTESHCRSRNTMSPRMLLVSLGRRIRYLQQQSQELHRG